MVELDRVISTRGVWAVDLGRRPAHQIRACTMELTLGLAKQLVTINLIFKPGCLRRIFLCSIVAGLLGIAALDAIKSQFLEALEKFERRFVALLSPFHRLEDMAFEGRARGLGVQGGGAGDGQGSGACETGGSEEVRKWRRV